jgi:predicted amidohydrolase
MKCAAVQMCSGLDVAANVDTARRLLGEAAAQGATLAVLPENFALMALKERDKRAIAETDGDGPVQNQLAACAREFGITVVAGTFPIRVPGEERVAAASLVYGPDGRRIGRYDKIHLFDVNVPDAAESHRESAGMVPGRGIGVFDTPAGRIGVAVCYDLRFPPTSISSSAARVLGAGGRHRQGGQRTASSRASACARSRREDRLRLLGRDRACRR